MVPFPWSGSDSGVRKYQERHWREANIRFIFPSKATSRRQHTRRGPEARAKNLSRESLVDALQGMGKHDFGGFTVQYSRTTTQRPNLVGSRLSFKGGRSGAELFFSLRAQILGRVLIEWPAPGRSIARGDFFMFAFRPLNTSALIAALVVSFKRQQRGVTADMIPVGQRPALWARSTEIGKGIKKASIEAFNVVNRHRWQGGASWIDFA